MKKPNEKTMKVVRRVVLIVLGYVAGLIGAKNPEIAKVVTDVITTIVQP